MPLASRTSSMPSKRGVSHRQRGGELHALSGAPHGCGGLAHRRPSMGRVRDESGEQELLRALDEENLLRPPDRIFGNRAGVAQVFVALGRSPVRV